MFVFKFGGASVKSAGAVRNIVEILQRFQNEEIVVVVSAMGKTTNSLERIIECYTGKREEDLQEEYKQLKAYHLDIMNGLFEDKDHLVFANVNEVFEELTDRLTKEPTLNYDYDYDSTF